MTPFAPPLPVVLRAVMAHAERFSELLDARERDLGAQEPPLAWTLGRADELRCLASLVNDDWRAGRMSPGQAAIELGLHLRSLHEGFARVAGLRSPSCCLDASEPTPPGPLASAPEALARFE